MGQLRRWIVTEYSGGAVLTLLTSLSCLLVSSTTLPTSLTATTPTPNSRPSLENSVIGRTELPTLFPPGRWRSLVIPRACVDLSDCPEGHFSVAWFKEWSHLIFVTSGKICIFSVLGGFTALRLLVARAASSSGNRDQSGVLYLSVCQGRKSKSLSDTGPTRRTNTNLTV